MRLTPVGVGSGSGASNPSQASGIFGCLGIDDIKSSTRKGRRGVGSKRGYRRTSRQRRQHQGLFAAYAHQRDRDKGKLRGLARNGEPLARKLTSPKNTRTSTTRPNSVVVVPDKTTSRSVHGKDVHEARVSVAKQLPNGIASQFFSARLQE